MKKQKYETPVLEQLFRYADHGINLAGFDIGNVRTIKEYERFAGIDFKKRRIRKFATTGNFGVEHTIDELRVYKYWEQ